MYIHNTVDKAIYKYSLPDVKLVTGFKIELEERKPQFYMEDVDALFTVDYNSDYDHIFIQSLSKGGAATKLMQTKLRAMVYHKWSRKLFYESTGAGSSGVYEVNFSAVTKGAYSATKFSAITQRIVDGFGSLHLKNNIATKNYLIIGDSYTKAKIVKLNGTKFEMTPITTYQYSDS